MIKDIKEDQVISEKMKNIMTGTIFNTPKIMSKRGYLLNLLTGLGTRPVPT
ncbi:hypothetical protein Toce_1180 [Thermosediminibacter oceani DSM 16646]|uniref:Uncharacterized protein n=1 Tax=Thermosediminibacter oceani (strain ATCC BAA-1034 / DSM 16646 / JW/IW-1228P) TaxID=555079 RepID=D9S3G1_THEOJ|nr:hypothetical protein Toce_1180 [Thermosediminibacter oceani DSM 16646]